MSLSKLNLNNNLVPIWEDSGYFHQEEASRSWLHSGIKMMDTWSPMNDDDFLTCFFFSSSHDLNVVSDDPLTRDFPSPTATCLP